MTEKQEKILEAALELFARDGYNNTSTSKVAKRAGVSEGLIFRHFENKDGLLQAIIKQGEEKARQLFADIVLETEPIEVIKKTLEIGTSMQKKKEDADFWKLQYKIKWEMEIYGEQKMEPLQMALTNAFRKLGYKNPEQEALLLLIYIDGIAMRFYLQKGFELEKTIEFLKAKYQV